MSLSTLGTSLRQPLRRTTANGMQMNRADYFCHAVAKAAVEVLNGARPLTQLIRWVSVDVYDQLDRRLQLVSRHGRKRHLPGPVKVRRMRLQKASDVAFEACAAIEDHERVRAVALRLERRHSGWRVVDLIVG